MNDDRKERASMFFPFDALKGLQEALREKERIRVDKKSLSLEKIEELSYLLNQIKKGDIITIVYYQEQEYLQLTGMVANIDTLFHTITVVNKKIEFEDILDITKN